MDDEYKSAMQTGFELLGLLAHYGDIKNQIMMITGIRENVLNDISSIAQHGSMIERLRHMCAVLDHVLAQCYDDVIDIDSVIAATRILLETGCFDGQSN